MLKSASSYTAPTADRISQPPNAGTAAMSNGSEVIPVIRYLRRAAESSPQRPALVGEDRTTYGELYDRVRRWSCVFARHGLGKGDRVAIWLPKSAEYLVALYAAMEIGGIYVPMDGMQPAERAMKILHSSRPTILVTDSARLEQLAGLELDGVQLIVLVDSDNGCRRSLPAVSLSAAELDLADYAECGQLCDADADDLAAILFTSGSTGIPKGVRISYRNLHTFVDWACNEFALSEQDVFSNHAGFHFDLSTFDFFAAAAKCASVWIIREQAQHDVTLLLDGLKRYGVSVWYSVPSVLSLMLHSGGLVPETVAGLRYVLFAGEVFPIRPLRELHRLLPANCALYNLYGPTETNVCLFHRVCEQDLLLDRPVFIGKPLPGQQADVVDENGCPVSCEQAIGELVITGSCVTPGYWEINDSANFFNHRQQRHATGDLVGWENGLFYYHGRKDRMLKINGNRVELGEIETALLANPRIREVAVVSVVNEEIHYLVAYVSSQLGAEAPGLLELKSFCRDRLPRYMIPRYVRRLDDLPKNQNGKIDYAALKKLASEQDTLNQLKAVRGSFEAGVTQ